jgi:hypothetical protein
MQSRFVSWVSFVSGVSLVFIGVLALAAQSASAGTAVPICPEDEIAGDREEAGPVPSRDPLASFPRLADEIAERTVGVVLPCAMAESGALGPWCQDAVVLMVTTTGVVLCEIELFAMEAWAPADEILRQTSDLISPPPPVPSALVESESRGVGLSVSPVAMGYRPGLGPAWWSLCPPGKPG